MRRIPLHILLAISGSLTFFRFGGPALIFGATGPGPFGNRWLVDGKTPTLLLDADLRFFGAMMIGLGCIFFLTIWKTDYTHASFMYSLAPWRLARLQGYMSE